MCGRESYSGLTPPTVSDPYRCLVTVALPKSSTGDVVLTATLLTLGQLTTWLQIDSPDSFAGSRWVNALVLAAGTLPLLWRRRAPLFVTVVSAAVLCLPHTTFDLDVTLLGQFVPLIVVTASCGYHATAHAASLAPVWAIVCMLAVAVNTPFLSTPTSFLFNLLILVAPWAAARGLRHREERARRLGTELEHERSHFEDRMAQAVERERAQIARDLHDIVAHGVSVMVVQIGGARLQVTEDPRRAERSLLAAEDAGRQALADLRRMLGVLRDPQGWADPQPRPGLRHLDALLQQAEDAGLLIHVSAAGDLTELPAAVDISAYRIVQEAVTNVIKHSHAARVDLGIDATDRQLVLTVLDPGPARETLDQDGYGLVGIRERVAFFSGHTRIGPDDTGGWQVVATIPTHGSAIGAGWTAAEVSGVRG
jgi:signal transduction histidine kinase